MNRRLVPRHTSVWNHWRVPSDACGITMRNVASVVRGRMSNSAPCVRERKPGHTPAGGVGVFSEMSETCVPAGGVPALTVYCTPPCEALVLHAVPGAGRRGERGAAAGQDVDGDRGRRRDAGGAAADGERQRAHDLVGRARTRRCRCASRGSPAWHSRLPASVRRPVRLPAPVVTVPGRSSSAAAAEKFAPERLGDGEGRRNGDERRRDR